MLARIVAEDAGDGEGVALAEERQLDLHARREAVDVLHRLANPDRVRGRRRHLLHDRERALRPVPRDQHERWALRIEDDAAAAKQVHSGYARNRAHPVDESRLEESRVAGVRGAEVQLGRQHGGEPLVHRLPEGRDHDRHRRHEREARDDRGEAHCGLSRRRAQLSQRQRQTRAAWQRQEIENGAGHARHERDRADQQAGDGGVAEKRQAIHRWKECEQRAADEQGETRQRRSRPRKHRLLVARLERLRGGRASRVACGQ